jgi:hypothetical protein
MPTTPGQVHVPLVLGLALFYKQIDAMSLFDDENKI